jgi:hypothetical protein
MPDMIPLRCLRCRSRRAAGPSFNFCPACHRALNTPQATLPGAETVRETEIATPAYDAPFGLTPKIAPAIPPRAMRLFNNRHED